MGQLFKEGEERVRPGISYRYSEKKQEETFGANDGINAIVMNTNWGPVNTVVALTSAKQAEEVFGDKLGFEAVKAVFEGGAHTVYAYKPEATEMKKGKVTIGTDMEVTAKHFGSYELKVDVTVPLEGEKKIITVYHKNKALESYTINKNSSNEMSQLRDALACSSYLDVTLPNGSDGSVTAQEYSLTGGADVAKLTAVQYATGFEKLEPYTYGYLSTDSDDMAVAGTMAEYVIEANEGGKFIVGVVGCMGDEFETFAARRAEVKRLFNSASIICLCNGFYIQEKEEKVKVEGARAVGYTAGVISSTPSNKSIVHTVIPAATDVIDNYKNADFESAIQEGMLLLSVSVDGQVWYDSGINTLRKPGELQDNGWKKIKRVKVRNELMDRIDRCLATKIGRVSCDKDGIADVLQGGIGILNDMVSEGKIHEGATMYLDPERSPYVDSAWFIIDADDIDSLEKIYLHYQFRYSQNV